MRHRKKSKKPLILTIICAIVVLLILCVVFIFPLNNMLRSVTGNDTPGDKAVKSELVKRVKSKKTGDSTKDKRLIVLPAFWVRKKCQKSWRQLRVKKRPLV